MRKLVATIARAEGMVVLVGRPGPRTGRVLQLLAARLATEFVVASARPRPEGSLEDLLDACSAAYRNRLAEAASSSSSEKRATVILIEDGEKLPDGALAELARLVKDRARPLRIVLAGAPELGPRIVRLELPIGGMVHAETCRIDRAAAYPGPRRWLLAATGGLIAAGFTALILTGESMPPAPPLATEGMRRVAETAQLSAPAEPASGTLARLLAQAEHQIAAGRLDTPENDNALGTYQEIVILAPEDTAGPHLLFLIRASYLDRARASEQRGDGESARRFRDTARLLTPERAALLAQSRP